MTGSFRRAEGSLSQAGRGSRFFVEGFAREARVLARLNHQNTVAVFDCGVAGPFAYFVMEYVDGVNLREAMQAGRFASELPRGRFLPPSKKSDVDARIDEIVMRTLECEREARYQTVGEVKTRVDAVGDSKMESPVKPESGSAAATVDDSSSPSTARFATLAAR